MLVRHSCTIRKIAISISCGNRPKSDGILKSTLILLRSENPSTYQRNADPRPASSSKGGCSRCEIVRISLSISSTSTMVSATALAPFASSLSDCFSTALRFMLIAATSCPTLSCISRAMRRRSSSCTCNNRAERLRKAASALFSSSSIRRLGMSEKRSICKQVKLRFLPYGTLGEDFYGNALMQLPASRSKNRAQGLGYAPMPTDHLAEVFRMDTQLKHDHLLSLDRTNLHLFRMVHESLNDLF